MDPVTLSMLIGGGVNFLGNLIGGQQQGKMSAEQLRLSREQMELQKLLQAMGLDASAAGAAEQRGLSREQMELQRLVQGLASSQMDPLAQQRSRGQFAMMSALMGNTRPYRVQAPGGMEGFVPQTSGGARDAIPAGGFGQDVMRFFGPDAAASAEGAFHNAAAPFAAPPDLTQVGYGQTPAAASATQNAQQAHAAQAEKFRSYYDSDFARSKAQREAMLRALGVKMAGNAPAPRRPRLADLPGYNPTQG